MTSYMRAPAGWAWCLSLAIGFVGLVSADPSFAQGLAKMQHLPFPNPSSATVCGKPGDRD